MLSMQRHCPRGRDGPGENPNLARAVSARSLNPNPPYWAQN